MLLVKKQNFRKDYVIMNNPMKLFNELTCYKKEKFLIKFQGSNTLKV